VSAFLGPPALRLLLRLKVRGLLRRQWRRLRTPKGFLLSLLGALAFCAWMASLGLTYASGIEALAPPAAEVRVRVFGVVLLLLSLSTALTNRGLYLNRNEIERLFSAPLSRSDLVRYRLLAGGLRSLIGGLVLGLFGARRMPHPPLAFAGIVLAMQTLPVFNQLIAISLGGVEERASALLKRVGGAILVGALVLAGGAAYVFAGGHARGIGGGGWIASLLTLDPALLSHPLVRALTAPFLPWARAISAPSFQAFWPWFLVCVSLHGLLVELCAALPVDFRERSLATSVRTAARLARFRRGGGVAATRASGRAARWRVPWLFGRGPGGAIAWRKSAGMVRKARGTLWMAVLALAFITLFVEVLVQGNPGDEARLAPPLIGLLGTIYLCSGLRFDFREELERMDVVRSWPLAPARIFVATLLPEVVVVSTLVGLTVLLQSLAGAGPSSLVAVVCACLPFGVFAWVALDNVVFLFAPVRFVPGQDGFVQNAGRRMIQMSLLLGMAGVLVLVGWLAHLGGTLLVEHLAPGAPGLAQLAGWLGVLVVLAGGDLVLVLAGGAVLRRFDLARDRG